MVNEKTIKLNGLLSRMLDIEKTHFNEVPKLFDEGLSLSSGDKEATRKLISALIERCIEASIEQDGTYGVCSSSLLGILFLCTQPNHSLSLSYQTAGHYEFNRESFSSKINNYLKLLKEPDSQLEVIYSVVKVVVDDLKNPKGKPVVLGTLSEPKSEISKLTKTTLFLSRPDMLLTVFSYLYHDLRLVSQKAFQKWAEKSSTRPGHAVAVFPMRRFIDGLDKNENSETVE